MSSTVFLSVEEVLRIHSRVIDEFGGDPGLRDRGMLEAAVAAAEVFLPINGHELSAGSAR